jgi:hypothetical protein
MSEDWLSALSSSSAHAQDRSSLSSRDGIETETDDGISRNSMSGSVDGGEGKKVRGNYKCQFCNVPKKGHECPFQKVYKRATATESGGSASIGEYFPIKHSPWSQLVYM